jgi:hypothetical protein
MMEKGMSYGEASNQLAFLLQDETSFRAHMRKIDNDLGEQLKIVSNSFLKYVETGEVPAPHYPMRVAIILRKLKEIDLELSFLDAWCRHFPSGPGQVYFDLYDRAKKLRVAQKT